MPRTYAYDKIWNFILNQRIKNSKTYLCGLVDFDNTPRMGKKDGHIMVGASPEKFYIYFKKLYQKSLLLNNEFIFVNAWNEWGEGMYLEPDEKNGYGYLEAIKRTIIECKTEKLLTEKNVIEDFYQSGLSEKIWVKKEELNNIQKYDTLLNNWMYLRDRNIRLANFLKKYGYQNVAIYGMGKIGTHLFFELRESDVRVLFGIDRSNINNKNGIKIYNPEDEMPKVDAVIITIINEYDKISEKLSKNMDCSMIAIEEIIQELMLDI